MIITLPLHSAHKKSNNDCLDWIHSHTHASFFFLLSNISDNEILNRIPSSKTHEILFYSLELNFFGLFWRHSICCISVSVSRSSSRQLLLDFTWKSQSKCSSCLSLSFLSLRVMPIVIFPSWISLSCLDPDSSFLPHLLNLLILPITLYDLLLLLLSLLLSHECSSSVREWVNS